MNVQWLERVARCQLDTYAAAGQSPADEPLSVPDARVTVVALNGAYGIDVTSEDWDAAREIYTRARAPLKQGSVSSRHGS